MVTSCIQVHLLVLRRSHGGGERHTERACYQDRICDRRSLAASCWSFLDLLASKVFHWQTETDRASDVQLCIPGVTDRTV